jgi:hypothetical protein
MLELDLVSGPKFWRDNIDWEIATRDVMYSSFSKHLTTANWKSYFMVSCRICSKNLDKEIASDHMKDHDKKGEIPLIRTKNANSDDTVWS